MYSAQSQVHLETALLVCAVFAVALSAVYLPTVGSPSVVCESAPPDVETAARFGDGRVSQPDANSVQADDRSLPSAPTKNQVERVHVPPMHTAQTVDSAGQAFDTGPIPAGSISRMSQPARARIQNN